MKNGLPYGWWRHPDFWTALAALTMIVGLALFLFWAWWL